MKRALLSAALVGIAAVSQATPTALAETFSEFVSREVQKGVSVENIRQHQKIFQQIADRNGGTRASGTPGYEASVDYVKLRLELAGYQVSLQSFLFPFFEENSRSQLAQLSPNSKTYRYGSDFVTMEYSGSGEVTAQVQDVGGIIIPPTPDPSSESGCRRSDFRGFVRGRIALIQRGFCLFADKVRNAQEAGASAVIVFNEGQPGRREAFEGTLGGPVDIPVLFASFAVGKNLFDLNLPTVRLRTDTSSEQRETWNVFADTEEGKGDRTVVVGAHLDSVPEGPGINDNGSGTAVVLETAIQMAKFTPYVHNRVRFAFFGAEEAGLLGSEHYVANLSENALDRILLNLNFDMLGSPNYVRFVYDGDGSNTPDAGPPGSEIIESVFEGYFEQRGLETEPTAFDGRSDYGPFIERGIPAGGLFSGAEGIKTREEERIYGGQAGKPYDPCYHEACDTARNFSARALDELGNAAAHAIVTFAMANPQVIKSRDPSARIAVVDRSKTLYRGHRLQK